MTSEITLVLSIHTVFSQEMQICLVSVNAEGIHTIVPLEFIFIIQESVRFSARFFSYKSWAIETIQPSELSAFLGRDGVYFSNFYLLYEIFSIFCQIFPFILMGIFSNFNLL